MAGDVSDVDHSSAATGEAELAPHMRPRLGESETSFAGFEEPKESETSFAGFEVPGESFAGFEVPRESFAGFEEPRSQILEGTAAIDTGIARRSGKMTDTLQIGEGIDGTMFTRRDIEVDGTPPRTGRLRYRPTSLT